MKLIVGLGNPGKEYVMTRHNAGFLVLDRMAKDNGIRLRSRSRFKSIAGEGRVEGISCYLAKPQSFMNLSGNSLRMLVHWLKVEFEDILVVIDDITLPFGKLRLRPYGSHGGHNGLRSVIECLGTDEIPRLRVGIRKGDSIKDTARYVLSDFNKKEKDDLEDVLIDAVSLCESWVKEGIEKTMNKYN